MFWTKKTVLIGKIFFGGPKKKKKHTQKALSVLTEQGFKWKT